MKRVTWLVAVASAVVILSGCATSGFLGFLATTQYVEREIRESDEITTGNLRELKQQVDSVREEVDEVQALNEQLSGLIDDIEETQAATEELQQLASQVEARLDALPRETIQQLVEILQQHLEETTGE